MEYLLSEYPEKPSLEHVGPDKVWESVSIPLLGILVRHGWDINQRPKRTSGWGCQSRMLNLIRHDEMIHWALEHGATVSDELEDDVDRYKDPYRGWYIALSLLDSVALFGSLEMMKHLYALGARPGRVTLRNAVSRAGSHPTHVNMQRVRYLIEELHVDVNQRDVDPGYTRPMAFGMPLMYAVRAHTVEGDEGIVVQYLLEHGADAFDRLRGNQAALRVLEGWKMSRGLSDDRER